MGGIFSNVVSSNVAFFPAGSVLSFFLHFVLLVELYFGSDVTVNFT